MTTVYPGRYTASHDSSFAVFLIGMRVNQFWQWNKWWPVASAMTPMLQTLYQHPEKGFLGGESFFRIWPITTCLITYWRSTDDLIRFSRNPEDPHWAAWQQFMRSVGKDGSVGIWHETYQVSSGEYECIYGNMPEFGLAKATQHLPIGAGMDTAKQRIQTPSR